MMKVFGLLVALLGIMGCSADQPKLISEKADLFFDTHTRGLTVKVSLALTSTERQVIFHLNPGAENLVISQAGHALAYKRKETMVLVSFESSTSDEVNILDFSYTLQHAPSRNLHIDPSQIYLFNESAYLPLLSFISNPDSVQFDITVNKELIYPYRGESHFTHRGVTRPNLVIGDFERITENKNGKVFVFFVPHQKAPVAEAFDAIKKTIVATDSLYTLLLRPLNVSANHIYFLERSGGHSLSPGDLVLDEAYLEQNSYSSVAVVAHEQAHAWWGQTAHSQAPALTENLADYFASLYLSTLPDKRMLNDFYAQKSMGIENEGYAPTNITLVTPEMGYRYKSAAYKIGPKLLYQLEAELGQPYMISSLRKLFLSAEGKGPLSYADLNEVLDNHTEACDEFLFYEHGKGQYPNYSVKDVTRNSVTIISSDQKFTKRIPLEVRLKNGTVIYDSVLLSKGNSGAWLTKQTYAVDVDDVIIDPMNTLLQRLVSDDTWKRDAGRLFMKNKVSIDSGYHVLAKNLLSFLLDQGSTTTVDELTATSEVKPHLIAAAEALRKTGPTLQGFEVYLTEETSARIFVLFKTNGKTMKGFIDIVLDTHSDPFKIVELGRISF